MYQKLSTQKASPSPRSKSGSKELKASGGYGSLYEEVQRAQQDPSQVGEEELQQLDSAIGTRATEQIYEGKTTGLKPEFKGVSTQLYIQQGNESIPIQTKLTIGAVGDKYEQEADRVAASVVQQINHPAMVSSAQGEMVQGKESQQDEGLKMKPIVQGLGAIGGGEASTELSGAINRARGKGKPLDPSLQGKMGEAMSADFSGVKVHTNAQSDLLNQSIQAKAFTVGSDVFFRRGEYNPGSKGGQELLAHELTHVLQQGGTKEGKRNNRGVIQKYKDMTTGLEKTDKVFSHNVQFVSGHGIYAPKLLDNHNLNQYVKVRKDTKIVFWSPESSSLNNDWANVITTQSDLKNMYLFYKKHKMNIEVYEEGDYVRNYILLPGKGLLQHNAEYVSNMFAHRPYTLEQLMLLHHGMNIHWSACRQWIDDKSLSEVDSQKKERAVVGQKYGAWVLNMNIPWKNKSSQGLPTKEPESLEYDQLVKRHKKLQKLQQENQLEDPLLKYMMTDQFKMAVEPADKDDQLKMNKDMAQPLTSKVIDHQKVKEQYGIKEISRWRKWRKAALLMRKEPIPENDKLPITSVTSPYQFTQFADGFDQETEDMGSIQRMLDDMALILDLDEYEKITDKMPVEWFI